MFILSFFVCLLGDKIYNSSYNIISIDEDQGLRIESFAVINLCGVSTNKTTKCSYFTTICLQKCIFKSLVRIFTAN